MADSTPEADYNSPWKDALSQYFESFIELFFPRLHADIDWTRGHESLDKELQQIAPDAQTGRRIADVLIRVWRCSGEERWVLIHVEVQAQPESAFPERMFLYHNRLTDRYNRAVASFAILADESPNWRPDRHAYNLWDCGGEFRFPTIKLLDLDTTELENNANPFAIVVLAHLAAQRTASDTQSRRFWKLRLIRGLYDRGLDREGIRQLVRLIDWFLRLPKLIERQVQEEIRVFESEKHMPYVMSYERMAREDGVAEGKAEGEAKGEAIGLKQGIALALKLKFGEGGQQLTSDIHEISDLILLRRIAHALESVGSIEELRSFWKSDQAS